jgi:3-hydroxyacyl-[acyl-carrier-protein] dehydratase
VHYGSGFAVARSEIHCGGKLMCNAELTFRLIDFPNAEFRASMEKMAAAIEFPMRALGHD